MTSTLRPQDYAATLLRLSLGILFLAHAGLKLFVFTIPGTVGYFESIGFPGFLAHLVIAGELVGGLALLAGVMTRWASLGLAVIAFGAIYPHAGNGWVFSAPGGGWEFPLFLGITALVQALLGPGAFALKLNAARA
ncbi:MAG: DoxX family protein [Rehaibacterium terrae]|uniref:DoxX family protein n=1 Tax=Rehaibacterium terrae TaxID=1341696 RepID=UPI00391D7D75